MEENETKRLTLDVPISLFCKIKAHASFQNTNIKNFVSVILYREIAKIEKEERLRILDKNVTV